MPLKHDNPGLSPDVPELLTRAIAAKRSGIESGELLSALTRQWGGVDALALSIKDEFDNASKGGVTRQRILEMFARLIVTTTEKEHFKAQKPTEMTNEELASFAGRYYERISSVARRPEPQAVGGVEAAQGGGAPEQPEEDGAADQT